MATAVPLKTIALYVGGWYTSSLGLTLLNVWVFRFFKMPFPLLIISAQNVFMFAYCVFARWLRVKYFNCDAPKMSTFDQMKYMLPIAICAALDIGLSNMSLLFIDVTLYTMVKSMSLVFVLMFGFMFKLERPSGPLILVILMITGGVVLFRSKENVTFSSTGFILIFMASLFSGLRWTITQVTTRGLEIIIFFLRLLFLLLQLL